MITPIIRKRPDHHIQIKAWINKANFHSYSVRSHKFLGKLDEAYEDYLLASKILMEIIPRCSGYAALQTSEWQYHVTYADLVQVRSLILLCANSTNAYPQNLDTQVEEFSNIAAEIVRDNEASGIVPMFELS
jgi:hypothetical protein